MKTDQNGASQAESATSQPLLNALVRALDSGLSLVVVLLRAYIKSGSRVPNKFTIDGILESGGRGEQRA